MFEGGGPVFPKTVKNNTDAGKNLDICASFERSTNIPNGSK